MKDLLWLVNHPLWSNMRGTHESTLSEFVEFRQSFYTRPNRGSENSVEPEQIPTELPHSSYSVDSGQAGKSLSPQNLTSLSNLQEWTWEHYRGLNLTLFTLSIMGSTVVFIGGVRRCCGWRMGAWGSLDRLAGHATWSGDQVSSLHRLSHIGYSSYWLAFTHGENRFWKCVNTWLAAHTLARLIPCFIPRHFPMSYCLWLYLILDIMNICIDFGPYGAFPPFDILEMVDQ
jgi:hypothetical protein